MAFDIIVISPLFLGEASQVFGAAALAQETPKVTKSAKSWVGHAFQLPWRHMTIRVRM